MFTIFHSPSFAEPPSGANLVEENSDGDQKGVEKRKDCKKLKRKIELNRKEIRVGCGPQGNKARCLRAIKILIERLIDYDLFCAPPDFALIEDRISCERLVMATCQNICNSLPNPLPECLGNCNGRGLEVCAERIKPSP